MEASAIQAGPGLRTRPRIALGSPLLRVRSDQQLVTLFREGNEDAFRVIHDRYRARLVAYMRQMLPGRPAEVEDALQDVFIRMYAGLQTGERELALRPWLYRVAHNRCIDELRRSQPVVELLEARDRISPSDPVVEIEQREMLRRLVVDIGRLPEQQRSALLMRELSGMAYADVADVLDISVPAVKSLLVRARIGLAQASEARDATCVEVRRELAEAHDQGVRASWMARRHMRDCAGCRECRNELRASRRQFAALAPALGPVAVLAKLFGVGTGAGGGTATAASAGGASAVGAGGTVTAASGLATVTVGHVATILAAAVVTAGGAVAVQQTVATHAPKHAQHAIQHAAPAASSPAGNDTTMRVPALTESPPAATPTRASSFHHTPAVSSAAIEAARGGGERIARQPVATQSNATAASATSSSAASQTTCTPPPTACTASETSTCSTNSGSSTSSGTTTTGGQTTTTPGQTASTGSGTTTGPTSGTTAPATSTPASSCSTTTQPSTATQGTGTQGTGTQGTGTQSSQPNGTSQSGKPV